MSKTTFAISGVSLSPISQAKSTLSLRLRRRVSLAFVFGLCTLAAPLASVRGQEAAASPAVPVIAPAVDAQAREPITVTLKVERIETDAEGKEQLVSAEEAKPGDTLLYTATCANVSDRTISGIAPVIPIPEGVTLLEASITPEAKEASLDGATFVAYPASRTVTGADGKEVTAPVPAAAYRAIRWQVAELAAGAATELSFRVSVNRTAVEAVPASSQPAQ